MPRAEAEIIVSSFVEHGPERFTKIVRHLGAVDSAPTYLPSLHVSLTDFCINRCATCGHWQRTDKTKLDLDVLTKLIRRLKRTGLESICFTGGDPFIYPDLDKLLRVVGEAGIKYGLVTGCARLGNCDLRRLIDAAWVRVSFDAATEPTYAKVRGGNITLSEVKNNIAKMARQGVNVQLGITVSRLNIDELPEMLKEAKMMAEVGLVSRVDLREVYSSTKNMAPAGDSVTRAVDTISQYKMLLMHAGVELNADFPRARPEAITEGCLACKYQLFIDADGTVYPCCVMAGDTLDSGENTARLGNIYEDDWEKICWAATDWRMRPVGGLPNACFQDCPPRLNAINTVGSALINNKDFY